MQQLQNWLKASVVRTATVSPAGGWRIVSTISAIRAKACATVAASAVPGAVSSTRRWAR